jgi:hypothetical protein
MEQKVVANLLVFQVFLSRYFKKIKNEVPTIDKKTVLSSPLGLPFLRIAHTEANSGLQTVSRRPVHGQVTRLVRMFRLCYINTLTQATT